MFAALELGHMLRSLVHHPYRAVLIIVQISITMAVMTNAVFIVTERYQKVSRHSGADEVNTFSMITEGFTADFAARATIDEDLLYLRSMPDVVSAVQSESVPYNDSISFTDLQLETGPDADKIRVAFYRTDEHGLETFDLQLVAGDNFDGNEVIWQMPHDYSLPSSILLSQATAEALFGNFNWQQAVGKTLYYDYDQAVIVKGVYDKLDAASPTWENIEFTVLAPSRIIESVSRYVVRARPEQLQLVMTQVEKALNASNPQRKVRSFKPMLLQKQRAFSNDYATIKLLGGVVFIVAMVMTVGIAGLVSLSVSSRVRQIGIRRALGANRSMVVRYYLLENLLLSVIGVSIGTVMAISLNMFLVQQYSLAPLTLIYLPVSMLVIIFISQSAALLPAFRAAKVSPATATRSI